MENYFFIIGLAILIGICYFIINIFRGENFGKLDYRHKPYEHIHPSPFNKADYELEKQLSNAYELVGNVEGIKLDKQQMQCIIKEAHSHLVIAGAGTGKTTTIIGKVKFLLNKGMYKPEEILMLSFTKDSASEMMERVEKEMNLPVEVLTFHKLGLNIIKSVDRITPKITQINLYSFIKEQLPILMKQTSYLQKLSTYLLYNAVTAKSEFEFSNETEYREYLECNPPVTLKNERMKSYGELDIANFLSQNRIAYEYEPAYFIDTRTFEYGQYHPDFYLPEYKIYIEYFGININGKVPAYFRGKRGKNASEEYQEAMRTLLQPCAIWLWRDAFRLNPI